MNLYSSVAEVRAAGRLARASGKRLGLVPTMGALHEGHLSLVREARKQCSPIVVSIFVNPKQFGPSEDFQKYPRTLDADRAALENLGVDYVFAPTPEEVESARRLLAAYEHATQVERKGAVVFEGQMIDEASRKIAEVVVARGVAAGVG